jgi:micrococcal nuclease
MGWRAKCDQERELAKEAKAAVETALQNASYTIELRSWDKFGGRILGNFIINGRKLSDMLVEQGLAQPYYGSGTKHDWCN